MVDPVPSWAVVATVCEPAPLVQAFVAWHLALGAQEVTVFLDRPDDPVGPLLAGCDRLRVIPCDAAHWRGQRPLKHEIRQVENATAAYRACRADWLLHCDADEFLWPAGDLGRALAEVPAEADAAVVPVAERVTPAHAPPQQIFDGLFRRPFAGSTAAGLALFGADFALTRRGLTGHAQGKAFSRTRRKLGISIHRPKARRDLVIAPLAGVDLSHFDGLTPQHWLRKLQSRADGYAHHGGMAPAPHRQAQIAAIAADPAGGRAVHDRLKCLSPAAQALLAERGLLLQAAFDPAPAIAARFGPVDLRMAAFDLWA